MATKDSTRNGPRSRNPRVIPNRRFVRHSVRNSDPLRQQLLELIRRLQLTMCVVTAAVGALRAQGAEQDEDIAVVLQRHVCDSLGAEIERWDALLGAATSRSASQRLGGQ